MSVSLDEEFIDYAEGIARGQNRSLSSLLGQMIYTGAEWKREVDEEDES